MWNALFPAQIPTCKECGGTAARLDPSPGSLSFELEGSGTMQLHGVPVWRCPRCGEIAECAAADALAATLHDRVRNGVRAVGLPSPAKVEGLDHIVVTFGSKPTAQDTRSAASDLFVTLSGRTIALSDLELSDALLRAVGDFIVLASHPGRMAEALGGDYEHRNFLNLWGPSGVGKTTMAQAIAHALGRPLWRLDAATVLCQYVGESEKNLRSAFSEARRQGAVLFIDEADTLVARRVPAQQSGEMAHNGLVNQLIQLLDAHDGVVVLASNLRESYDPALARRVLDVHVPAPDAALRKRLWRRLLAVPALTEPVDDAWLTDLDAAVDQAQLSEAEPFTAADMKAVRAAAVAAVGRANPAQDAWQITCRDIERGLEAHLDARAAADRAKQAPDANAKALASVIELVMAGDGKLIELVDGAFEASDAAAPALLLDAHSELIRRRKVVREQWRTVRGLIGDRLQALRYAGLPQRADVDACLAFADAMQATMEKN